MSCIVPLVCYAQLPDVNPLAVTQAANIPDQITASNTDSCFCQKNETYLRCESDGQQLHPWIYRSPELELNDVGCQSLRYTFQNKPAAGHNVKHKAGVYYCL